MSRFKSYGMTALGVGALSFAAALSPLGQTVSAAVQRATGPTVTVANTPSQPVPVSVQGTASVSGAITVANTPNVKLDPSGNTVKLDPANSQVQVSNTSSNPVSVQSQNDAPSHPFTTSGTCTYGASTCDVQFQTVPAGKMFVIENLSLFIDVQGGSFIDAQVVIEPTGGGNAGNVRLTAPLSGTAHTHNFYDATQLVRLYAPASSVLEFFASATSDATTGTAQIFLSGYLVNTPS